MPGVGGFLYTAVATQAYGEMQLVAARGVYAVMLVRRILKLVLVVGMRHVVHELLVV